MESKIREKYEQWSEQAPWGSYASCSQNDIAEDAFEAGYKAAMYRQQISDAWQPIETAPRDGEVILVYRQDAGVFPAHYVESRTCDGYEVGDECWFSVFAPTTAGV